MDSGQQFCQSINNLWDKSLGEIFFGQIHIWVEKYDKEMVGQRATYARKLFWAKK